MVPSGSPGGRTQILFSPGLPTAAKRDGDMHARELVELAAIVSAHGPVLVRRTRQLSTAGLEQYWAASRSRLDRWHRSLKCFAVAAARHDAPRRRAEWPTVRGVFEEVLTGEMLTRVWTAVMCAYDRHHGVDVAEPIARSVLVGHMEARHRVLTLLVRGSGIDAEAAVKLNHLRRRTERWTDLLIGYLAGLHDVGEFAVDPERAKEFAGDLQYQSHLRGGRHAWPLVLASVRAAFQRGLAPTSPNADLNRRIASTIIACFPGELFDSTGLFQSVWLMRLSNVTDDVQVMVDDLLALEPAGPDTEAISVPQRLATRLRRFQR